MAISTDRPDTARQGTPEPGTRRTADAGLEDGAVSDALSRLIRASWQEAEDRAVLARAEALIARGQEAGEFRTDLPHPWLVTTYASLLQAATQEVGAGRLEASQAPGVLAATILAAIGDQTR